MSQFTFKISLQKMLGKFSPGQRVCLFIERVISVAGISNRVEEQQVSSPSGSYILSCLLRSLQWRRDGLGATEMVTHKPECGNHFFLL